MKKIIYTFALICFSSVGFSQYVQINEFESENIKASMGLISPLMSAMSEVSGKSLNMVTFRKEESNTYFFVRSIESLQQWVDEEKEGEENGPMMMQKLLEVENIQDKFQAFLDVSDNKGSRLYEIMDEYSNMSEYFQLSPQEQQEYKYRRIVLHDLTSAGEQAFLANQKIWMEADKKLGVNYMYALLKPVFATDSDFMLVLLDKSRFDYHTNWSERMKKRFSDADFNENYDKNEAAPVSTVVDEWNLKLIEEYKF